MRYSVEEVGTGGARASCAARIAGRCSVFAKTDMIHAQQKGHTPRRDSARPVRRGGAQFQEQRGEGPAVVAPVAFIGGVAQNAGVTARPARGVQACREPVVRPRALRLVRRGGRGHAGGGRIAQTLVQAHPPAAPARRRGSASKTPTPLSMENVVLLRDRVGAYLPPPGRPDNDPIPAYLGIDIGSVSTNLVVIDETGAVIQEIYLRTRGGRSRWSSRASQEIEGLWGQRLDIRGVGTTGSGRELIGELVGADTVNDEITAHKTGAMHVCQQMGMEPVDTIFEIGGQDSKFIRIEQGRGGGLHHERGLRGGHRIVSGGAGRKAGDLHQGGIRAAGAGAPPARAPGRALHGVHGARRHRAGCTRARKWATWRRAWRIP